MKPLSHLALNIRPSTTLAIDAMFKQMKAEGQDMVGFGAGEPDFHTPDYIKEAGIEAQQRHQVHSLHRHCGSAQGGVPASEGGLRRGVPARRDRRLQRRQDLRVRRAARPGQLRRRGHPVRALLGQLHRAHSDGGRRARGGGGLRG